MNKLIEFNVPGGTVVIESQEAAAGNVVRGASLAQVTEKVGQSFEDALSVIRPVAETVLSACDGLAAVPDSVEVQFGLKFNAEAGAVIAKVSSEGSLGIKLVWKPR